MESCLEGEVWLGGLIFSISFFSSKLYSEWAGISQPALKNQDVMTAHAQDLSTWSIQVAVSLMVLLFDLELTFKE